MECPVGGNNGSVTDIESLLIPEPRETLLDPELMESVVRNMIQNDINSREQMQNFINKEQRRIHQTIPHNQLLYRYKKMI